jgi:hypothetical protein
MICEISVKSPCVFLEAFQPIRIPESARKVIEKIVENNKPHGVA